LEKELWRSVVGGGGFSNAFVAVKCGEMPVCMPHSFPGGVVAGAPGIFEIEIQLLINYEQMAQTQKAIKE